MAHLAWALGAVVLLPLACALPLLDVDVDTAQAQDDDDDDEPDEPEPEPVVAEPVEHADDVEPEPEPEPPPPPEPLTPEQLTALLDAADQALDQLDINIEARRRAKGPMPPDSGLAEAYAEGRATVLEGRLEQIRQWAALAKFGSREPGSHCGRSPLAPYDLIVTRDERRNSDIAYLHIVVPAIGLPGLGERGRHEAWIDGERWVNLGDRLESGSDYLLFKTNGKESLHRQWAKREVVESLASIAAEYRQRTSLPLGIGDLSHVTGGKIEDHWTHQQGVDVDLYVIDPSETDSKGRPKVWWSHVKRGGLSIWTSEAKGKGKREPTFDPSDELSHTATSLRLEVLAQIVFLVDEVAYFVHNDTRVLAPFDDQAGTRRPGRRFLHARNRGFWPTHADHVHLRWVEGKLPVGDTPRP